MATKIKAKHTPFELLMKELAYKIASKSGGYKYIDPGTIFSKQNKLNSYTGMLSNPNSLSSEYLSEHWKSIQTGVEEGEKLPNILRMYLELDEPGLPLSKTKPVSQTLDENVPIYDISKYTKFDVGKLSQSDARKVIEAAIGKPKKFSSASGMAAIPTSVDVANAIRSVGEDEKGKYLSLYDLWDFRNYGKIYKPDVSESDNAIVKMAKSLFYSAQPVLADMLGEPMGLYARHYLSDEELEYIREIAKASPGKEAELGKKSK